MSNPLQIDFKKLSLQDALDLAIYIELEAEERYESFAELVGSRYAGDAGDFFVEMAKNEKKHATQLQKRRRELFGSAKPTIDPSVVWDVEAPEHGKPRAYMSARQAMHLAHDCEVKAYQFFDQALKQVSNKEVRELFEELREEEREHQKMLEVQMAKLPPGGDNADRDEDDLDDPTAL